MSVEDTVSRYVIEEADNKDIVNKCELVAWNCNCNWGFIYSEHNLVNKDISSYKVFDDKNSKTEKDEEKGLFNVGR